MIDTKDIRDFTVVCMSLLKTDNNSYLDTTDINADDETLARLRCYVIGYCLIHKKVSEAEAVIIADAITDIFR